jgi:hypothetical protein
LLIEEIESKALNKNSKTTKLNAKSLDITPGDTATHQKSKTLKSKQAVPNIPVLTPPSMDVIQRRPNNGRTNVPEHAKTLMRSAVHKPYPGARSNIKARSPKFSDMVATSIEVSPKLGVQTVDGVKSARAQKISKNQLVHRFSKHQPSTYQPSIISPQPVIAPRPAAVVTMNDQPSPTIFERAIEKANSHEQPYVTPDSKRWHMSKRLRTVSGLTAVAVIMAGVLIYQNVNGITLYVASSKAGFSASMPSYKPAGFSLGNISAGAGEVAAKYTSNSDGRVYSLSEQPSDWDTTTLAESYVYGIAGNNYHTINSDGITIFVYGNNNATWVSGGIWYQLTTKGSLSQQQIIEIVDSVQ